MLANAGVGAANEKSAPPTTPPTTISSPSTPRSATAAPRVRTPQPEAEIAEPLPPEPVDTRLFFDAMLGVGSEHLSLGLGLRGGKTFENHFYLGGLLVYHVGTSTSATAGTTMVSSSMSGFYVGPELGYDIPLAPRAPIVLRPYLGLGWAEVSASTSAGTSASSSEASIWPGVAAHYHLADSSYDVGADFRLVTGPWGTALGLFVLGGMHFGS